MLIGAVICFAVAALGGVVLAVSSKGGKKLPMPLSLIHGIVAAAGLVLLIIEVLSGTADALLTVSLVLFLLAAVGGFVLFSFHLKGKNHPGALLATHGLAAVAGFVVLLIAAFSA